MKTATLVKVITFALVVPFSIIAIPFLILGVPIWLMWLTKIFSANKSILEMTFSPGSLVDLVPVGVPLGIIGLAALWKLNHHVLKGKKFNELKRSTIFGLVTGIIISLIVFPFFPFSVLSLLATFLLWVILIKNSPYEKT